MYVNFDIYSFSIDSLIGLNEMRQSGNEQMN